MLSIHESGLLQVWKRRWWPKSKIICPGAIVTEAKPITLIDVQSAFYVAAGGAVIGFLVFIIEVIVGKWKKNCKGLEGDSRSKVTVDMRVRRLSHED